MAEEITNATEMAEGEEIRSATKKRCFDVSLKGKKRGGGRHTVIVCMPALSRPFLINIAFALKFYSPSFSIRCFPVPES